MAAAKEQPGRLSRLVAEDSAPPRRDLPRVQLRPQDGPPPFDFAVIESIVGQLNDPDPD